MSMPHRIVHFLLQQSLYKLEYTIYKPYFWLPSMSFTSLFKHSITRIVCMIHMVPQVGIAHIKINNSSVIEFKFYLLAPWIHFVATCLPNSITFPRVVCDFLHTLAMLAEFNRSENTRLLKIRGGLSASVAAFSQRMKKQQAYYFSLCSFRPDGGVCVLVVDGSR